MDAIANAVAVASVVSNLRSSVCSDLTRRRCCGPGRFGRTGDPRLHPVVASRGDAARAARKSLIEGPFEGPSSYRPPQGAVADFLASFPAGTGIPPWAGEAYRPEYRPKVISLEEILAEYTEEELAKYYY